VKLLLDTHALLWWAHEPEELSDAAREAIANGENEIFVSAVSAMEISTKNRVGRLEYPSSLADNFLQLISEFGFQPLSVSCAHAERAGNMAGKHRDPWDRLLAAQAQIEQMPLITVDPRMSDWDVQIIW
jgi:PIN domain nuclease of toxin-antitoxin system